MKALLRLSYLKVWLAASQVTADCKTTDVSPYFYGNNDSRTSWNTVAMYSLTCVVT